MVKKFSSPKQQKYVMATLRKKEKLLEKKRTVIEENRYGVRITPILPFVEADFEHKTTTIKQGQIKKLAE